MAEDSGAGVGSPSPASSVHSFHSASDELRYDFDASKGQLSFGGKTYHVNVLVSGSWVSAKSSTHTSAVADQVNKALQDLLRNLGDKEFETAEFYNTGEYRYKTDSESEFISGNEHGEYESQIRQVYLILGDSSTSTASGKRKKRREDDSAHSTTSTNSSRSSAYLSAVESVDGSDDEDDDSVYLSDDDSVYESLPGSLEADRVADFDDEEDLDDYMSAVGDLEDRADDLGLEGEGDFDDDGGRIEGEMEAMGAVFGAHLMAAGEPDDEGRPASLLDRSIAAIAKKFLK